MLLHFILYLYFSDKSHIFYCLTYPFYAYSYLSGANMQKEDHTKHHNDAAGGIHDAPLLPPIKIVVTKGEEDVSIKIADQGGGMPRSVTKRIWTFAHST